MQKMQESQVRSLGLEDPLEMGMATHFSNLDWRIPWMEEPGGLRSTGLQEIGHDSMSNTTTTLIFDPMILADVLKNY